jgi:hypothetical protein
MNTTMTFAITQVANNLNVERRGELAIHFIDRLLGTRLAKGAHSLELQLICR